MECSGLYGTSDIVESDALFAARESLSYIEFWEEFWVHLPVRLDDIKMKIIAVY